jgi:hypothetical protein
MTVSFTSINAYKEHKKNGKVASQSQFILNSMESGVAYSRRELAKLTGLELSSVCGRVNELLAIGMIIQTAPRKCLITKKTIKPVVKDSLF